MDEEKEFYEMMNNAESFKNELKALIEKYDVSVWESDQYNGIDEFCGTDKYFKFNNMHYPVNSIDDIVYELLKAK